MEPITTEINVIGLHQLLEENGELFEKREEVDIRFLPRNLEVLAMVYSIKAEKNYHVPYTECYPIAAKNIINMWEKTEILVATSKTVIKKITQLMAKYNTIKKQIRRGKCFSTNLVFLNDLFIISSCTCIKSNLLASTDCKCPPKKKVPASGLAFLIDQQTERNFTLDNYPFAVNKEDDISNVCDSDYDNNNIVLGQVTKNITNRCDAAGRFR